MTIRNIVNKFARDDYDWRKMADRQKVYMRNINHTRHDIYFLQTEI